MCNCPEYLEILYACWHAGLVAVPVNARLHRNEFAYILESSQAKICFATHDLAETIAPLAGETLEAVVDVSARDYQQLLECEFLYPWFPANRRTPPGCFIPAALRANQKARCSVIATCLPVRFVILRTWTQESPWRVILHAAPMSHGSGVYALAHVMQASCHVIPESGGFDVEEVYHLIESWPAAVFFAAPTMVKRLLDPSGRYRHLQPENHYLWRRPHVPGGIVLPDWNDTDQSSRNCTVRGRAP